MSLASSSMDGIVVPATKDSEVIPIYTRSRRKVRFSNLVLIQDQYNEIIIIYMMTSLWTPDMKKGKLL